MTWDDELRTVRPEHLALFLQRHGWQRLQQDYFATQQWVHLKSGIDVLLPNGERLNGYERYIDKILRVLSRTESRSVVDLLREIKLSGADVLRIRRPTREGIDMIPLTTGRAVVDSALRMLGAAAVSAVTPRAILPGRRPKQALDYLDHRVSLGHTEKGSYIVTVVSDVTPLNTPGLPGLLEYMEAPFPRVVTRTLNAALCGAHEFAPPIAEGDLGLVQPAAKAGISADLLEAVAGMLEAAPDPDGFSLSISWSAAYPEAEVRASENWFAKKDSAIFLEAARRIRETEPLQGVAVTGIVEGLRRGEGETDGIATVACIIDQVPRKVHVSLSGANYDSAILAHRDNRVVVFRANVEKRGNRFVAADVVGFRLTDD